MAIIPQINMFVWEKDLENSGDLERLRPVLENIPDERLMRFLETRRGKGRDDFPVRAMWNMQIAKDRVRPQRRRRYHKRDEA